ncbi:FadR family transcriptional regulator [Thermus sp. SYSU G05001]|uniref:FadR family transcriptional regulator n=2 Tax=Thermus TaxID=270 RepID=A0ABS6ZYM9_9DEIN|nr:FadR/GntR family transcriptional regulator [Thermus brevis]MBW6395158.1 FadR family transcriptional regulator [Thermus brevis]
MRRTRLANLIAHELETLIQEGVWVPGAYLPPERVLADRFKVSRVSIREALRLLEARGVIEIHPSSGARVRSSTTAVGHLLASRLEGLSLTDLFEFRYIVEPEAAALAAKRADKDVLDRLAEILTEQEASLQDVHGFLALDLEFHRLIAVASGNGVLQEMVSALNAGLRETRLRAIKATFDPIRSLEGHRRVLKAILSGDADGARQAMRQHLKEVEASALGAGVPRGGDEGWEGHG